MFLNLNTGPLAPRGSALAASFVRIFLACHTLVRFYITASPPLMLQQPGLLVTFSVAVVSCCCLIVGYRPRLFCMILSAVHFASFYSQALNAALGFVLVVEDRVRTVPMNMYFLGIVFFLLAFTPCGTRLTFFPEKRPESCWSYPLLRLLVGSVYFWSAAWKLNAEYLAGNSLETIWAGDVQGSLGYFHDPALHPWFLGMAWASVLLEAFLAVFLFVPRLRNPAMLLGAAFHLITAFFLNVGYFATAIVCAYLFFLETEEVDALWRRFTLSPRAG